MLPKEVHEKIGLRSDELAELIWSHFPEGLPEHSRAQCVCEIESVIYKELKKEAERSQKLVATLESIRDGYDHDEDAHRYNNLAACRCCAADKALNEYNNTEIKPK